MSSFIASRSPEPLLAVDEPPPYQVINEGGASPFFIICDHAGRRIPRALGTLGLGEVDLGRHIAWDIGAAGVTRALARELDAFAILQTYSRLVVDCNRPLTSPTLVVRTSEDTEIPGNLAVSPEETERRVQAIFEPYHARIRRELDQRTLRQVPTVLVFLHSFTPRFRGVDRRWHTGMLFQREARLAKPLLELLRSEGGLEVGENEPYSVDDASDYAVIQHGEKRGLLHVEVEIRQDLIENEIGQRVWAERFARLLPLALARALPTAPTT